MVIRYRVCRMIWNILNADSLFSGVAPKQQLERLAKLMLSTKPRNVVVTQALRSAQFWELPNLRRESNITRSLTTWTQWNLVVFLSLFDTETSFLDDVDVTKYFSPKEHSSLPIPLQELGRAISTYEVLLCAPAEYLSRTCRTILVRRAVSADILSSVPADGNHTATGVYLSPTLRIFLQRTIPHTSSVDHSVRAFACAHPLDFFIFVLDYVTAFGIYAQFQARSKTIDS